jgi:hypothetical protein
MAKVPARLGDAKMDASTTAQIREILDEEYPDARKRLSRPILAALLEGRNIVEANPAAPISISIRTGRRSSRQRRIS